MFNKLPKSRTNDFVVQKIGNSIYIYDRQLDDIFCLSETTAIVFQACDGQTSVTELKDKKNLNDEEISLALDELKRKNLLECESEIILSLCAASYFQTNKIVVTANKLSISHPAV